MEAEVASLLFVAKGSQLFAVLAGSDTVLCTEELGWGIKVTWSD